MKKKRTKLEKKNCDKNKGKAAKTDTLLIILIIITLLIALITVFMGGTYGYDYYPGRFLYK